MARKKSKTPKETNPWRWPSPWWKNNPYINIAVICTAVFYVYSIACSEKEQSAEENFQQAGELSRNEETYEESARLYRKAAEQGHAGAQAFVGSWYEYDWGIFSGVEEDHKQAVEWYRKAAEQGDDSGQFDLGEVYFKGRGVLQDYDKAAEWHLKAAKQRHAGSLERLANMYANGQGVEKNTLVANAFFLLASWEGHGSAKEIVEKFNEKLTTEQITAIENLAKKTLKEFNANLPAEQVEAIENSKKERDEARKSYEEKLKNQ